MSKSSSFSSDGGVSGRRVLVATRPGITMRVSERVGSKVPIVRRGDPEIGGSIGGIEEDRAPSAVTGRGGTEIEDPYRSRDGRTDSDASGVFFLPRIDSLFKLFRSFEFVLLRGIVDVVDLEEEIKDGAILGAE